MDPNLTEFTLTAIRDERRRQDQLYPSFVDDPQDCAQMALVLGTEVGELLRELHRLTWPVAREHIGSGHDRVLSDAHTEAIQVAAVAARIAEHIRQVRIERSRRYE